MSLINDALKRARLEAAQREAEEKGLIYPTVPSHGRRRALSLWAPLLGLAALVVIGVLVFLLLQRPALPPAAAAAAVTTAVDSPPAAPASPASPAPPAEATREAAAPVAASAPGGTARGETAAPATAAAPPPLTVAAPQPPPSGPPAAARQQATPPVAASGVAAPNLPAVQPRTLPAAKAAASPPPAAATAPHHAALPASAAGKVFDRIATLPDGRSIELNGIAWSDKPVAVLNGKVLVLGERVEGLTLESIERKSVELREGEVSIYIRLP